jgi:site-specific DNA-methyltransferase (adenine-specific)
MINKVHCADCLEFMKQIPDKSIDLVLTDPPYGMEFQSNYRANKHDKIVGDDKYPAEALSEFFRIAKRAVYVFCRWDNIAELPKPKSVLCWIKNDWSMGDLKHGHGRQWEAIAFYPMEQHEFIKRIPDVITGNRTGNNLHPTEKPVDVMAKIIQANVGDTILDPFCGSGSTLVACKELNRNYIGIEISEKYCNIARERLKQHPLF